MKYRREELEKLKRLESYHQVVKLYTEMNKEIQMKIDVIQEHRREFVVKQMNKAMVIDNRASLPDIFTIGRNSIPKQSSQGKGIRSIDSLSRTSMKLPAPPISQIGRTDYESSKRNTITSMISRNTEQKESQELFQSSKQPKQPKQSKEKKEMKEQKKPKQTQRKKYQTKQQKKNVEDELEDSITIVSTSCSDTIEEEYISQPNQNNQNIQNNPLTQIQSLNDLISLKTRDISQSKQPKDIQSLQEINEKGKERKKKLSKQIEQSLQLPIVSSTRIPNRKESLQPLQKLTQIEKLKSTRNEEKEDRIQIAPLKKKDDPSFIIQKQHEEWKERMRGIQMNVMNQIEKVTQKKQSEKDDTDSQK